jgi:hypothetical protein
VNANSEDEHGQEKGRRRRRKRKTVTKDIVETLGDVIGQLALKDSRFNKEAEIGSLYSARRLARALFANLRLSQVQARFASAPRSHLIVDGSLMMSSPAFPISLIHALNFIIRLLPILPHARGRRSGILSFR